MKAWLLIVGAVLCQANLRAAELTVHAAASLTDALKELAPIYEKQTGDKLVFNFGASSTLARQIQEGAPADVFFSADEAKMNGLEKAGLVAAGTRENILGNTLVIVVPDDSTLRLNGPADLTGPAVKRLALAEPSSVPAGVYAKEYLTKLGLWDQISGRIIATENVRACLAAVESGNVEAGIVYQTDALISKKVKIAYAIPVAEGPRILYPLAALKESRNLEAARRVLSFLGGGEARTVFTKYGFTVLK
jgi:molybdate transport system substrate-binding protein